MGVQPHHEVVEIQNRTYKTANALAWLAAAGVDVIVDETPRNWLAPPPRAAQAPVVRAEPVQAVARRAPSSAASGRSAVAAIVANSVNDIAALDLALAEFAHPLRQPAPPQLIGGNIASGLVIIADQPEAANGDAARLLARMIASIGLDDATSARAHLLPWNLPAGRAPRDEEIADYAPFLARALALVTPRLILTFGDKAAALAGSDGGPRRGIASMRGKWLAIGGVPMIATFHPRQLLAQPELKRLAWADLQAFQERMTPR